MTLLRFTVLFLPGKLIRLAMILCFTARDRRFGKDEGQGVGMGAGTNTITESIGSSKQKMLELISCISTQS